jgi:hypothetical protein
MYRVKKSGKNRVDHEIVQGLQDGSASGWAEDRRSAVRIPCHRPARVAVEENGQFNDEVATVRDISCSGVGLHLGRELAPGTLLTIESHNGDGPKILIARVVRSTPRDGGWFHGCELSWPLSIQDLHSWLGEAANETLC